MKPIVTSSLVALAAGLILGGCAVAPVDGPYAYGYARPYYYDNGPVYYDAWPGYYYGPPAVVGSFRFSDRDHRWSGSSWRHNSLTLNSDRTTSRTYRAPRVSTSRSHTASRAPARARTNCMLAHHDSDKS